MIDSVAEMFLTYVLFILQYLVKNRRLKPSVFCLILFLFLRYVHRKII